MTPIDLEAIRERWGLARLAGIGAEDAGNGWDAAKIRAVVHSWQDVAPLMIEADRLRAVAEAAGELTYVIGNASSSDIDRAAEAVDAALDAWRDGAR